MKRRKDMKNYIDGINFHELEAQKYWTPPASWAPERKKEEVHNAIFSGDYVGARKMDGAFYKFLKDEDGNMELLGRSKSVSGDYLNKIEWVPQLQSFFEDLPNGTCLIGEIYFPDNEGSNNVTTIMGCLKEKAMARQEKGDKLHYYIFDVLAWNGSKRYVYPIETRVKLLDQIADNYQNPFVEYALYNIGEELWNNLQEILADGGEGIVITKMDGTSKGGIILAIREELGIPVRFIGLGEGFEDLEEFDLDKYLYGLCSGLIKDE
jgi:hypothetical protein